MKKDDEKTPLEKHAMFFDTNQDGIIYPWETYQGFRKIGGGFFLSVALSTFIHFALSSNSRPGKFPSPVFPIVIENIKLDMHGSDSGAYDREGKYVFFPSYVYICVCVLVITCIIILFVDFITFG
nr:probable peroxygenase 5 isoform X1 [Ipomoea batatas]